jgi:hypothetical protein
MAQH